MTWILVALAAAVVGLGAALVLRRQRAGARSARRGESPSAEGGSGGGTVAESPSGGAVDLADAAASGALDPRSAIVLAYGRFLQAVERRRAADVRPLTPTEVAGAAKLAWQGVSRRLDEVRERFEEARYSAHPIAAGDAADFCRTVAGLLGPVHPGGLSR